MLEEHAAEGGNGRTRVCVGAPGFAIVVTIAMLALLAVVTLGFLSLSTIQVRQSTSGTSGALRQIGMMERAHESNGFTAPQRPRADPRRGTQFPEFS